MRTEIKEQLNKKQYITNLFSVLSLGLTFVPSLAELPHTLFSLRNFERDTRIKHFFRNKPAHKPHPFKEKSSWIPPVATPTVEKYLDDVKVNINAIQPLNTIPNLTHKQKEALNQLASDSTLVIKSADKGSGIVVEDTEQYVADGKDHLSDKTIYPYKTPHYSDQ